MDDIFYGCSKLTSIEVSKNNINDFKKFFKNSQLKIKK
jgi:hypothetical protein